MISVLFRCYVFNLRIYGLICRYMCTSPIQITRTNSLTHQSRTYVVPCGKCEECLSFKRQEFAALSIHQAMVSGSLFFLTLTYDDEHLPVAISDGENFLGFDLPSHRQIPISWWYLSKSVNQFQNYPVYQDGLIFTPSLCREDIKRWHKQFRVEYQREHGELPSYKYCFFGELGEQYGRPHYHGLIYGASKEVVDGLVQLWRKRFGYCYCVPSDYRQLTFEELGSVSGYVSKYISKGVCSRFSHLLPYIEKPRRVCSQGFGAFTEDDYDNLRKYYDGADICHLPKDLFCQEVLRRRSSFSLNGQSFPIPFKLKNRLFYDESSATRRKSIERDESFVGPKLRSYKCLEVVPSKNKRSAVSLMVADFARSQFDKNLDGQLRKDSFENSKQVNRRIVRQVLDDEKASARSREEIAQKNNLINLKTQKDGQ